MRNDMAAGCAACGTPLPRREGPGRPARFCSPACRVAAHRRRRQGLAETEPRWTHPLGRLTLAGAGAWEAAKASAAEQRQERKHLAAQRRAWRRWRHALAAADRERLSSGSSVEPKEAGAVWAEILAAERECAALGIPRVDPEVAIWMRRRHLPVDTWEDEIRWAEQTLAELTPPHLTRAEMRRRRREGAKAERRREPEERALETVRRALRELR